MRFFQFYFLIFLFDLKRTPSVIVLSGYGLNSETETLYGFTHCGASGQVLHINDLMDNPSQLDAVQILAILQKLSLTS